MIQQPILEVKNIGKAYKDYGGEWCRVLSWFGLKFKLVHEIWTLQDISFSLAPGEAIGIIGQNGAGKSTLLKIITGTLKPTTGRITAHGKIAAILELGMGFHPDLTGRQNAYHSAGLMGYSHEQIDSVIEDIEAFAEVGTYFDEPVRLYSSGMQVRVAFAVATAFRPDILIIDEALSVGDTYFQHKSFDRIRQFRNDGTSLLFVSHDKGSILALCDRAILIEKGKVLKDGEPEEVTDYYNALIAEKENSTIRQEKRKDGKVVTVSGTSEATIEEIGLYNTNGEKIELADVGETIELRSKIKIHVKIEDLTFGYMIKDRLGQVVFGTNSYHINHQIHSLEIGNCITYSFFFDANLGVGSYSVTVAAHSKDTHLSNSYQWIDQALIFSIVNISKNVFTGLIWMEPTLKVSYDK
jgi:lipopolysaccharide transport system ATP-binding protein